MGKIRTLITLLGSTLLSASCASLPAIPILTRVEPTAEIAPEPVLEIVAIEGTVEEDLTELMAQMRHDLSKFEARAQQRVAKATSQGKQARQQALSATTAISNAAVFGSLQMPIVGLGPRDLEDNFGVSREGGKRRHKGIDIFAPKGSELVAVADGHISYIGEQRKGGRCLWLVTDYGVSFYYAHLDRWAPGIYEGMPVKRGALLGYVGNTGNAAHTPAHLHFQIVSNAETVNPYPLLRGSKITVKSRGLLAGGLGRSNDGTQ